MYTVVSNQDVPKNQVGKGRIYLRNQDELERKTVAHVKIILGFIFFCFFLKRI